MIRISSTSNGRQYSSQSDFVAERKLHLQTQPAWFHFDPCFERWGTRYPSRIEIGCRYNARVGNDSLIGGSKHIREGTFSMPFNELMDICLSILEEDKVSLDRGQLNRLQQVLQDQKRNKKKLRE